MQQDKTGEYYNIDFENCIDIDALIHLIQLKFPKCNLSVRYNQEAYESIHDTNTGIFNVWITLEDLKEDNIYYFSDVKLRCLLYVSNEYNFSNNQIIKFLHDLSMKLHSKIYIPMEDVEENLCSFSYYSIWCIDNDKRKIMFDAQEFFDDCQNQYCEYLLM